MTIILLHKLDHQERVVRQRDVLIGRQALLRVGRQDLDRHREAQLGQVAVLEAFDTDGKFEAVTDLHRVGLTIALYALV